MRRLIPEPWIRNPESLAALLAWLESSRVWQSPWVVVAAAAAAVVVVVEEEEDVESSEETPGLFFCSLKRLPLTFWCRTNYLRLRVVS